MRDAVALTLTADIFATAGARLGDFARCRKAKQELTSVAEPNERELHRKPSEMPKVTGFWPG